MTTLFHVSNEALASGQSIEPGRWGIAIRQFSRHGNPADANVLKILVWESSLEVARRLINPGLPSRLNCVFGVRLLRARAFRDQFRNGAKIYLVELVDPNTPCFHGDYDLITQTGDLPFIDIWADRSIAYWTSKPSGIVEVLIGGRARVAQVAE